MGTVSSNIPDKSNPVEKEIIEKAFNWQGVVSSF